MQVVAPNGYFHCVIEDSNGVFQSPHWVLGWAMDDDGSVTPLTIEGLQAEAVGIVRPTGEVELFGLGVFANMGEARTAWLDRSDAE
ncbi:hypothetical protein [Terricaulis silvestris]|uniref:Uncharacterized protein n=1 Tax=Terricaulis silvestris TaxID=2686094 RepID=A0A6I6MNF4_9CAUL|nr:hypothetical protein [Terricaulis silvestris]QGZ94878.1 hypothetical protein DSM104635_01711 [Terricaulis silvestris]